MSTFANDPSQMPSKEDILGLSGLEFIQAIIDGKIQGPPIGKSLNYWLTEATEGRVVFRGAPKFESMNPIGSVHGGWYGTLLDSCMACAVQTMLPKGKIYTTLEYKINIVRPIPEGVEVDAIGEIQHFGRSTGVAQGCIVGVETGKLYATGTTTCIVMDPR